jgi:hypothetical protein
MELRGIAVAALVITASACASVTPVPEYPPGALHDTPREQVRALGAVVGEACRDTAFHPLPREEDARLDARRAAARLGASGVIAVTCRQTTVWQNGCNDGWRCEGQAFRIEPAASNTSTR